VNALTTPAYCPISKQPELKHAAVKILKAELPWSLLAMAWLPADTALNVRTQLRQLADALPFASCVPFGATDALTAGATQRTGVLLRAAGHDKPDDALLAKIESLLGLAGVDTLRYADARRGQRRAVRLARDGVDAHVEGVLLAGDTRAESWIKALLQDQLPAQSFGRQLLSFQPKAPAGIAARGKTVCSCFGVSETAIGEHLSRCSGSDGERLASLQGALKCGTNCGSCLPELKRMVRSAEVVQ
jgi:assimilatory nitrate reductase catalytic subunit